MKLRLFLVTTFSLSIGLIGHLVFYPIIESWHSKRMRRLARPAIGVLMNAPAFMLYVWLIECRRRLDSESEENCDKMSPLEAFFAYCASFMWDGAGVALGYLIGDKIFPSENEVGDE